MVVSLRDGVAMIETLPREGIAPNHRAISGLAMALQPGGQGRPDVEIQRFVVVENMHHRAFHRMRVRIRGVAFAQDALVPVGKRRRAGFGADQSGPRTLARRLIEMTMQYQVTRFRHRTFSSGENLARTGGLPKDHPFVVNLRLWFERRAQAAAARNDPRIAGSPF